MGMFRKLFKRGHEQPAPVEVACPHTALIPQWDRTEDMGKEDLATSFRCDSCRASFSGDEGRRLLHTHRGGVLR